MQDRTPIALPVGFETFHKENFIDYQLNRLHAFGCVPEAMLHEIAADISNLRQCVEVFEAHLERAITNEQLRAATYLARGAEFFTPPSDEARKRASVERFQELFSRAFEAYAIERSEIPYKDGWMPVSLLRSWTDEVRGSVLFCGGFDSLVEEFFPIWERMAVAGYDVYAFEGPGQGAARALGGLTFEHDWEAPVGAILDHYGLEKVTLVGMSMGGYWALRAAAHEDRIDRVVSWPPVYDWLEKIPGFLAPMVHAMSRRRGFMNWSIGLRMKMFPILEHTVHHAVYISGGSELVDCVDWLLGMNREHLSSEKITQDVLIMAGEEDAFQSLALAKAQASALTNARRVQQRIFTREEHAASHCQMGNIALAADVLCHWLQTGEVR